MTTRENLELRETIDRVIDVLIMVSNAVLNEEFRKARNIHKAAIKQLNQIGEVLDQELTN